MRPTLSLADLVPKKTSTFAAMFAGGLAVIAALGVLYCVGIRLSSLTTDGMVAAFDLDSEGSLATWFSIIALAACGLASLLVRELRAAAGGSRAERRAWLLVSLLWFTMSMDEGASLHEAFKEMMVVLTGTRIHGDGSIYWAVPYAGLLLPCGVFMASAYRDNRPAVNCLLAGGFCFALAAAGQLDWLLAGRPLLETWFEETCEMLAVLFIGTSLGLYSRSLVDSSSSRPLPFKPHRTSQPLGEQADFR
jgi:hypothetical protein